MKITLVKFHLVALEVKITYKKMNNSKFVLKYAQ